MSIETVEQAIVYVLKFQKSFIVAEAEAALSKGDAEAYREHGVRRQSSGPHGRSRRGAGGRTVRMD